MNLYLIRHGKTSSNVAKVYQGKGHVSALTPDGHLQARRIASQLRLGALLSGPTVRALETAAPIALASGIGVRTEALLDELDYGPFVGMSYATLPEGYANVYEYIFNGGDADLQAAVREGTLRARALLARLRTRDGPWEGIGLVSHGSLLHILTCLLLEVPVRYARDMFLDNGEYHEFSFEGARPVRHRLRILPRAQERTFS